MANTVGHYKCGVWDCKAVEHLSTVVTSPLELMDPLAGYFECNRLAQRYNNYHRIQRGNTPGKPEGFPLLCRHRVKA